MNDSNALSGGTTISMNRLKQTLANHLSELEGISGRVHIKKLTLDLGLLAQMEFNKEFFERFELVCGRLKEKLIALHQEQHSETSKVNEEKRGYIMDHLYSIEQTEMVRKFQYFIETVKTIPTLSALNDLKKRYSEQFSHSMPTEMLELLKKLMSEMEASPLFSSVTKQLTEVRKSTADGTLEQKHVDYLLFLFNNTRMDNRWFEHVVRAFKNEFRMNIPAHVLSAIKRTFDDFHWGITEKMDVAEKRYLISEEAHLLGEYLELHGEVSERIAFSPLLALKHDPTGQNTWYVQFLEGYFKKYDTAMPQALQEQLLRYNAWKKGKSWRQLDQRKRDLLRQKLEGSKGETSSTKRRTYQGISSSEIAFILQLLEKTTINAAWFSRISAAFVQEFGRKIPKSIETHLLDFSLNKEKDPETIDDEITDDFLNEPSWKKSLQNYASNYPEMGVFTDWMAEQASLDVLDDENWEVQLAQMYFDQTGNPPTRTQLEILRNFKRKQDEKMFQTLFPIEQNAFASAIKKALASSKKWTAKQKNSRFKKIRELFSEVAFSEAWLADIQQVYENQFKTRIPEKMLNSLIDNVNEKTEALESAQKRWSKHRKSQQVSLAELNTFLERLPATNDLKELLEILPDATTHQQYSEIHHIISGFEAFYSKKIPVAVRKLLVTFYKDSKKQTKRKESEELIFLKSALEKQLNTSSEAIKDSLADEVQRVLSILDSVRLSHYWKKEFDELYFKQFGRHVSKKVNDILDAFSKTLNTYAEEKRLNFTAGSVEFVTPNIAEWSRYLESNFEVYGAVQLFELLLTRKSDDRMTIHQLTELFEDELSQRFPVALSALLGVFKNTKYAESEVSISSQSKTVFIENVAAQLIELQQEEDEDKLLILEEESLFLQAMIESFPMDASWLPRVFREYENVFNRKLSTRLKKALFEFTTNVKSTFDGNAPKKKIFRSANMDLERFLRGHEHESGVKQLIEVVQKSGSLTKKTWFSHVVEQYQAHFQQEMPLNCQELLLKFSGEVEWSTWKMAPVTLRNELVSALKPALIKVSQRENTANESAAQGLEELSFLLSLLEHTPLDGSWLATLLKEFKAKFKKELSPRITQLLMDFSLQLYVDNEREALLEAKSEPDVLLKMLTSYFSADFSKLELEWLHVLLSSVKYGGKDWTPQFIELCSEKGHDLSEEKREQLTQFNVNWQSALKISKGEQLQKILLTLISNYFSEGSLSISPNSRDEQEKCVQEFIDQINKYRFVDFTQEWEERFGSKMELQLIEMLREYGMAIQLSEQLLKSKLLSRTGVSEANESTVDAFDDEETEQRHNSVEKEYLQIMSEAFVDGWMSQGDLEKGYERSFSKEFPKELRSIFWEVAQRRTKDAEAIVTEFRNFLEELDHSESVRNLLELIQVGIQITSENWFETILKVYADKWGAKMPFSQQQVLLNFAQTRKPKEGNSVQIREYLKKQRESLLQEWNVFVAKIAQEGADNVPDFYQQSAFIALFLENHTLDKSGLDILKKLVESKWNAQIPPQLLNFLTERERVISSKKREQIADDNPQKNNHFQQNLIHRIEKNHESKESSELIDLIKASDGLGIDNWFQQLLAHYLKKFSAKMPISHQAILLKIAQEKEVLELESESVASDQEGAERKLKLGQEIEMYFKKASKSRKYAVQDVLNEIKVNCLSETFEDNWMELFSENYSQRFGVKVPEKLQEKLSILLQNSLHVSHGMAAKIDDFISRESTRGAVPKIYIDVIQKHMREINLETFSKAALTLELKKKIETELPNEVHQLIDQLHKVLTIPSVIPLEERKEIEAKIDDFISRESTRGAVAKIYIDVIQKYMREIYLETFSKAELTLELKGKFETELPNEVHQLIDQLHEVLTIPSAIPLEERKEIEAKIDDFISRESTRGIVPKIYIDVIQKYIRKINLETFSKAALTLELKEKFETKLPNEVYQLIDQLNEVLTTSSAMPLEERKEIAAKIDEFIHSKSMESTVHLYTQFIKKQVEKIQLGKASKDELRLQFEKEFGIQLPLEMNVLLDRLIKDHGDNNQDNKWWSELEGVLTDNFIGHATKETDVSKKEQLMTLISGVSDESESDNWVNEFTKRYEQLFYEDVPAPLKEMLAKVSAYPNKKSREKSSISVSYKEEFLREIERFFSANSEELPPLKSYKGFILEQLNGRLLDNRRKEELISAFKAYFGYSVPSEIMHILDRGIAEQSVDAEKQLALIELELNNHPKKGVKISTVIPTRIPKKKEYSPSNKVKLLKLKETLKQLQKGKKEDPDRAVSNAGIIVGWVLWKSIFNQFGWLNEGKFVRNEKMDASELASAWLHASVGEDPQIPNPLILFMCGIEEYQSNPISKEQLQEQLGSIELEASIDDYYETLLSMWPIFEPSQKGDLIELFIRREGLIQSSGVGMKLKVVKEPYDLLMERNPIPWPISLINFSWTTSIIEVEW